MRNIIPGRAYVWQPGRKFPQGSASKGEGDVDGRLHRNGLATQHEWTVARPLNGLGCRALEHGRPTDYVELLDRSVLRDNRLYYDCSLDARSLGNGGINGLDWHEQLSRCDSGGDVYWTFWGGWFQYWR